MRWRNPLDTVSESWLPLGAAVVAFGVDFVTPLAITDYYVLPIFLCLGARSPRVPLRTAGLITPLLVLGFFIGPPGSSSLDVDVINRTLTLLIVWVGALVTARRLQSIAVAERASAEARASERRFRIMADGAPAMIWVTDQQAKVEFVNRKSCDFMGVTLEQLREQGWRRFLHPDDLEQYLAALGAALKNKAPFCARIRVKHATGGWRWVESSVVPRFSDTGGFLGHVGISPDVTPAVEGEQALLEADRRKDEFLAMLSHELRNPLAPIRNAAQILGSPDVSREQLHWASGVIRRQSRQMTALLDDLLDLGRVTQGRLKLRLETVSFRQVVDSAVEAIRPLISRKDHQLAVSLPPGELMVRADPARLSQVISNLLVNAAKYTDAGGRIDLLARIEGGMLCVSVKDNGIGIPPQSLDHIFRLFSQIDASSARTDGGIGIGLALVKGIVELHGGTVEARSEGVGRGSEFIARLPIAICDAQSAPTRTSAAEVAGSCRRVIVADDNQDAAESLAMLLGISGHEVRVAYDGRTALSLAQTFRPQVAILDIGMPGLDGYALAQALRAEPWAADAFLIALTGWGQDEDKSRAAAAGFDAHLTKPLDPQQLTSVMLSRRPPEHVHSRSLRAAET